MRDDEKFSLPDTTAHRLTTGLVADEDALVYEFNTESRKSEISNKKGLE